MNNVAISGNLTRDPEILSTSGDKAVCKFGVAVEQSYKDANGEWQTKAHFVDCTVFGGRGTVLAEKARKGDLVFVSGRLDFSTWEKDGEKRSKLAVVANEVGGEWQYRKKGEAPPASEPVSEDFGGGASADDDIPF